MKRIYIVDDDRDIVESISMVLQGEGYETAAQYDEISLLANVKSFGADLIILDVMFPEDESAGFRMARELREDSQLRDTPILMLSAINERGLYPGRFSDHDRDDAFLPVDAFVEKPISPNNLVAKVAAMLS